MEKSTASEKIERGRKIIEDAAGVPINAVRIVGVRYDTQEELDAARNPLHEGASWADEE